MHLILQKLHPKIPYFMQQSSPFQMDTTTITSHKSFHLTYPSNPIRRRNRSIEERKQEWYQDLIFKKKGKFGNKNKNVSI